jgi:dihydroorotase-like cyclic amidohydrolase
MIHARSADPEAPVTLPLTIHDLLDPLSGDRVSLRIEGGKLVDRAASLDGGGVRDIDGSDLWILPAIYDADAHFPLVPLGLRESDVTALLAGGVARTNVALQWQDVDGLDFAAVVAELAREQFPRVTPILSVHSDTSGAGFPEWISANAALVKELLPPVCKLYSYSADFWECLDALFANDILPVIYCKELEDIEEVVARASGPVHFRHAISDRHVELMGKLPGVTMQTSPHFLLPVLPEQRSQLYVLPPVPDDDVRQSLLDVFLDRIDFVVSDHNAPPFGAPTGPGLQVEQDFLSTILTAVHLNDWPLDEVWAKVTTVPAARYQVDLSETFVVVDPNFERTVGLYPPRQTVDRAPYLGTTLRGRVLAMGVGDDAVLV